MDQPDAKPQEVPIIIWPEPGQIYADKKVNNRTLTITEVQRIDPLGRNVIGIVKDGRSSISGLLTNEYTYACDMQIFGAVWVKL